jgi:asparagine synthase (glutamine-hydrolysing)
MEPGEYYQELRATFSRILPKYFNGPERIGMSLTGGLDTRMIMAWHKAATGTLPCYSFGGPVRECQDVLLARRVAQASGQPFEVIPLEKEFFSRFAQYAERAVYLTDGCVNVNRASDLYLNERAAQIAPVRMTGNYGGEILRQLRAFKPVQPAAGLFRPEFLTFVDDARRTYSRLASGHALSFIAFGQAPWHHYGLLALEQTQLSLRSPYLDNDLVRTAFRAPAAAVAQTDIFEDSSDCTRLIAEGSVTLAGIRTDRGLGGNSSALSSAVTRGWLEFTFKAEYAYDYGMPQWVAGIDHQLSWLHLERLFLGRHKFNHYRVWYRDILSEYVCQMLLDSKTLSRPYLDRAHVETVVKGHLNGNRNYTTEIHQLLTVELIHRLFLDSN